VHVRKVPTAPDVDLKVVARGTPGFSGADLANLVNEAALLAARRSKRLVTAAEFEDAKDKVMMGAERRTLVMSDEEKRLTAYHEAGHALVALHMPASDPIHKATIIPRGRALGMVMRLPEKDQFSMSRDQLEANLVVAMGGRVAEDLVFGREKVTTGASNDIAQATEIARKMVTEWGMSDKLGPLRYNENQEEIFLGHSVAQQKNVSDATAEVIDQEVREIVDSAENVCRKILTENLDDLHTLAKALLEYETLSGDEIHALLRGESIVREKDDDTAPPTGVRSSVPTTGGGPVGTGPEPEPQGG
ncbi:MAG: ATP-dependent metallopeptidase FtsH/Yme1/Tma family protein, partial [Alphaproteobacteria bacterium]|nr:ATP-dependent metallopeptidase FtsH/Yme1/Tma family protein [Alphaproteobacteria bacterium]